MCIWGVRVEHRDGGEREDSELEAGKGGEGF